MIAGVILILLFYLFAVLQISFFVHFAMLGATINLVIVLFFLVIFFLPKKIDYRIFAYAFVAGLLLDVSSNAYFGISIMLLMLTGYLFKKIQLSLKESGNGYPLGQFLALFIVCFTVYSLAEMMYFKFLDPLHSPIYFNAKFFFEIIYNTFASLIGFYIFKKFKRFDANIQS